MPPPPLASIDEFKSPNLGRLVWRGPAVGHVFATAPT